MIDFWIFPLSTIWGAYQIQGFAGFSLFSKKSFFLFAKRGFLLIFEIFCKKIFFSYNKKILTFFIFSSIFLLSRICKKRYCRYPINNTSKIYSQMSQADIRNLRK